MNNPDDLFEEFTDAENTENNEKPRRKSSSFRSLASPCQSYKSSEVLRILGSIEFGNPEEVEPIILDSTFMSENEDLVKGGDLIRKALDKNLIELIVRLEKVGYIIPDDLLLRSIKQGKSSSINTVITSRLYSTSSLELELWYLVHKGYIQFAERLKYYESNLDQYSTDSNKDIYLCAAAMKAALERHYDGLASKILNVCPAAVNAEMIEIGINNDNLEFIRRIWTGHIDDLQRSKVMQKRNKKTPVWNYLKLDSSFNSKITASKHLNIAFILKRLLVRNMIGDAKKVIMWPEAADNPEIFKILVEVNQEELARLALKHRKKEVTRNDFEFSFKNEKFWVCLDMLRFKSAKTALLDKDMQREIVELLADGSTCYFAAEFLSHTDIKYWNDKLVVVINDLIISSLKTSDSFVKCPYPILQLVLMSEFLIKISQKSLLYKTTCIRIVDHLLKLAKFIQDSITEELELKHFLYLTDSKGRSVLNIISQNGFYTLLKNEDLGSIVSSMWAGERKTVWFLNASRLYKSFKAPKGSEAKLQFLSKSSDEESFTFQFEQLISSCQLRFIGQIISTVLLVYFYTMTLYTTKGSELVGDNQESQGFLRVSQVWISGIFAEQIIQNCFCILTHRKISRDLWIINDAFIFIITLILINHEEQNLASSSALSSIVGVRDLNVILHSIVLCLIWLRFFHVLLTTYNYGPMLMIMYQMGSEMIKFLLVFFSVIFIASIMMSLLFNNLTTSGKFDEFGTGISKMFTLSLGTFELADYSKYLAFGAVTEGFLVIILNVLMLNILIATLSVTYEKEQIIQTSKFRSILIESYNRLKWDDKYGVLILLPPPLSFFSVFILPAIMLSRDPSRITGLFARFIFILYVIPFFAIFATISLIFAFVIYFSSLNSFATGGVKKLKNKEILLIKSQDDDSDEEEDPMITQSHAFSYRRAVVWILIGWAFALNTYLKDCFGFWEIAFRKSTVSITAKDEMIDSKFVQSIYLTLKTHKTFMIRFDDFLETFYDFDFKNLSPLVKTNHDLLNVRKKMIENFFKNFFYSKKSRLLKREFIKTFVEKSSDYSEEFINRLKFVRIHLVLKALKKYKKNSKEITIQKVKMPKHVTSFGCFQIKQTLVFAKDMMKHQRNTIKNFKQLISFQQVN